MSSIALKLVTPPAAEPVSLEEARAHLRVDTPDDDALIGRLITAARQQAEEYCRRAFGPQTWKAYLDEFEDPVILERSPVTSITSITYVDPDGVTQTLSPSAYQLDGIREPARVMPAYGRSWPPTRAVPNAVQITFECGEGTPEIAKAAMLQGLASWYANREATVTGTIATELPGLALALLDGAGLRAFRFG